MTNHELMVTVFKMLAQTYALYALDPFVGESFMGEAKKALKTPNVFPKDVAEALKEAHEELYKEVK